MCQPTSQPAPSEPQLRWRSCSAHRRRASRAVCATSSHRRPTDVGRSRSSAARRRQRRRLRADRRDSRAQFATARLGQDVSSFSALVGNVRTHTHTHDAPPQFASVLSPVLGTLSRRHQQLNTRSTVAHNNTTPYTRVACLLVRQYRKIISDAAHAHYLHHHHFITIAHACFSSLRLVLSWV